MKSYEQEEAVEVIIWKLNISHSFKLRLVCGLLSLGMLISLMVYTTKKRDNIASCRSERWAEAHRGVSCLVPLRCTTKAVVSSCFQENEHILDPFSHGVRGKGESHVWLHLAPCVSATS